MALENYRDVDDGYDTDSSRYYWQGEYISGEEFEEDHIARWGKCQEWEQKGEDGEYIEAMQALQKCLSMCTSVSRLAAAHQANYVNFYIGGGEVYPVQPHDYLFPITSEFTNDRLDEEDILCCPSLQPFLDALRAFPEDKVINSIIIKKLELSDLAFDFNSLNLGTKCLISLELDDVDFRDDYDADPISNILEVNTTLEILKLSYAWFIFEEQSIRFENAIEEHPMLRYISFENCFERHNKLISLMSRGLIITNDTLQ